MSYQPGLHIIAEISVPDQQLLNAYQPVQHCIDALITGNNLQKLGDVYHNFEPHGYTAVVCLSESHLSLHAWPEYNRVHLDVYLSNFSRNNDAAANNIFDGLVDFFKAEVISKQTLRR